MKNANAVNGRERLANSGSSLQPGKLMSFEIMQPVLDQYRPISERPTLCSSEMRGLRESPPCLMGRSVSDLYNSSTLD
jgi:hypothetical protein